MTSLRTPIDDATATLESTIEFRVTRPGMPRRRLRLVGPKYTFGRGAECSVRLDDPSVRPMHASIIRHSNGGVALRAFGAPILVNGMPKTETDLYPGDRFCLGTYEFELLSQAATTPATRATQAAPQPAAPQPAAAASASSHATHPPTAPTTVTTNHLNADGQAEPRVVPRRRLSFADTLEVISQLDTLAASTLDPTCSTTIGDFLANPSAELILSGDVPEHDEASDIRPVSDCESIPDSSPAPRSEVTAPESIAEEVFTPPNSTAANLSAEEFAASAGTDEDLDDVSPLPHPLVNEDAVLRGRQQTVDLIEQHQAILANERRWQERSRKQRERHEQREQRARQQLDVLRQAQELAEQRARQAEDTVHSLRSQLAELSGRVAAMSGSMVPGLEMRLDQQQQDAEVANRQVMGLTESLRKRLDFIQNTLESVRLETLEIRQRSDAHHERQEEAAAESESLEKSLRELADQFTASRARDEKVIDELRSGVHQSSERLTLLGGELEETRLAGHSLSALVQQLRSSLNNLQSDSQRFATLEQIETLQRELSATDQRMSRLADEYDLQSQQLRQDCDELRQRLEAGEDLAQQAVAAATDALNRVLHQVIPADAFDVPDPFASEHSPVRSSVVATSAAHTPPTEDSPAPEIDATFVLPEHANTTAEVPADLPSADLPSSDVPSSDVPSADIEESAQPTEHEEDQEPGVQNSHHEEAHDAIDVTSPLAVAPLTGQRELSESQIEASITQSRFFSSVDELLRSEEDLTSAPWNASPPANKAAVAYQSTDDAQHADAGQWLEDDPFAGLSMHASHSTSQNPSPNSRGEVEVDATSDHSYASHDEPRNESQQSQASMEAPDELHSAAEVEATAHESGSDEPLVEQAESLYQESETAPDDDQYVDSLLAPDESDISSTPLETDPLAQLRESMTAADAPEQAQPAKTATTHSGPRSAADILASMGISIDDEEEPAAASAPAAAGVSQFNTAGIAPSRPQAGSAHASVQRPAPQPAAATPKDHADDEEESIEDYMNRLLQRVQGGTSVTEPTPPSRPVATPTVTAPVQREAVAPESGPAPSPTVSSLEDAPISPAADVAAEAVETPAPYVPRSQAPERVKSMAAMRELANSSARTAIEASVRRRMAQEAMFKFAIFLMGVLSGTAILIGTRMEIGRWLIVALCCYALSVFFLFEALNLRKRLQNSQEAPGRGEIPTDDDE